ncbi:hypothetical protein, partial [Candidatus Magnetobacterium casense]
MRVAIVHLNCCIRAVKQARALKTLGLDVKAFTFNEKAWMMKPWVETASMEQGEPYSTMLDMVADFKPDIIHVHNEPDKPALACIEGGIAPVIWDLHDMRSMRMKEEGQKEARIIEGCAGLVHVSEPIRQYCLNRYKHKCPSIVVWSAVNSEDYQPLQIEAKDMSLVYQGGYYGDEQSIGPRGGYRLFD